MADLERLPLRVRTPDAWAEAVLADFDAFLIDHAGCERKAAASALSLISRYSEFPALVETMTTLAREELEHFGQVFRLLQRRGLKLGPDPKDPYVNLLLAGTRTTPEHRLLDRLIASAYIEARSCERFRILADRLGHEPELQAFYEGLYKSEAGHYRVFTRVAARLFGEEAVAEALERLAPLEAGAMLAARIRPAVH